MDQIVQLLDAGGNGALIMFAYLIWRLDRRVIRIELILDNTLKEDSKHELV